MTQEWISIARADEVSEGAPVQGRCGSESVCLYRIDGQVYATQDKCTHGEASLSEGYVLGEEIECPFHQGTFHIPTGKAMAAPCTVDLRIYEVKEEGGLILLKA